MKLLFVVIFFLASGADFLHAQVKVDTNLTGKHAKAVKRAKQTKEEAKQKREEARAYNREVKAYKKELKEYRKAKKQYREKYDSIRTARMKISGFDSLGALITVDSLTIAEEVLEEIQLPEGYRQILQDPPTLPTIDSIQFSLDSAQLLSNDSLLFKQAEQKAEGIAKEYLPEQMKQSSDPLGSLSKPDGLPGQVPDVSSFAGVGGGLSEIKKPQRPNPNLIKPEQARSLFKKIDPEKFLDSQKELQKLKKKYSKLPDSRDPSEGIKRNSLQDAPFKKRLYFGGNLSLQSTDPLILSSNLQLGYWINKKWLAGVGFVYREQFTQKDSLAQISGDSYGYSLFTRYDIKKSYFIWGEGEFQVEKSLFGTEVVSDPSWQQAYLLGFGKEFTLGPVNFISLILYDFNFQNNSINNRPWVFRIGWRL